MADQPGSAQTNLVYLSLGSNIEPERHLPAALADLAHYGRIKAVSTVWETEPVGFTDQPNFLNAALILETHLSAQALRDNAIVTIEAAHKRVRTNNKNAPRTIDIDIMLFNQDVLQLGFRRIPDPEVLERPFVAIPLAEIAPDYVHPETGQTLQEIARQIDTGRTGMRPRPDIILSTIQPIALTKLPLPTPVPGVDHTEISHLHPTKLAPTAASDSNNQ